MAGKPFETYFKDRTDGSDLWTYGKQIWMVAAMGSRVLIKIKSSLSSLMGNGHSTRILEHLWLFNTPIGINQLT